VLDATALALRGVASEQDDDRVEVGAGEASDPVIRMIRTAVAEHFRAGHHALLELFGKRAERRVVHAEGAQAVTSEGDRDPAVGRSDGGAHGFGRMHRVQNRGEPRAAASRATER
jgi:hypothetical protein